MSQEEVTQTNTDSNNEVETVTKEEVHVDHLDEDPVMPSQKFCLISILDNKRKDSNVTHGIKIRGVFATREAAEQKKDELEQIDPYHNIYLGEVGKWLPLVDDPTKADDQEYREKELNRLMKRHKDTFNENAEKYQQRTANLMEQGMKHANKQRKRNKRREKRLKKLPKGQNIVSNIEAQKKSEFEAREHEVNETDEQLKNEQLDVERQLNEFCSKEDQAKAIKDELDRTEKELVAMLKKQQAAAME